MDLRIWHRPAILEVRGTEVNSVVWQQQKEKNTFEYVETCTCTCMCVCLIQYSCKFMKEFKTIIYCIKISTFILNSVDNKWI